MHTKVTGRAADGRHKGASGRREEVKKRQIIKLYIVLTDRDIRATCCSRARFDVCVFYSYPSQISHFENHLRQEQWCSLATLWGIWLQLLIRSFELS